MENPNISPENNIHTEGQVPKKSKLKAILKEIVIFVLIAVCIVLPFRVYIAEPYLVDGRSMDPTFKTGDYLIVDKLTYRRSDPKRNTVVVFHYPNDPKKSFIKRIIGLPGETVEINDNEVKIYNTENPNGFKIDQSYVEHQMSSNLKVKLSSDEYFVMGDNRAESFDSRSWGPLKRSFISGKPILRLFPFSEVSVFPGQDDK
jgi:signal peptidase I